MAGGAEISTTVGATLAESAALAIVSVSTGSSGGLNSVGITIPTFGPYRDKQQNKPATYSISVPASSNTTPLGAVTTVNANGVAQMASPSATAPTLYVFDAVMIATHSKSYTPTRKPLQSGYNTSDHIIKNQPQITLEIGMSDAMAAFAPGQWIGNPSKSISAWQVLSKIADNRVLVTLATRQETYTNMVIVSINSPETNKTVKSLKATVTFEQMLLASVTTITQSARPNATDETQLATLQTQDVAATTIQQNSVPTGLAVPLAALPANQVSCGQLGPYGIPVGGAFSSNCVIGGN